MAYNRNGGSGRATDFKDGKPTGRKGRVNNFKPRGSNSSRHDGFEDSHRGSGRPLSAGYSFRDEGPRVGSYRNSRPAERNYSRGGSRMEDYPSDIPPRGRRGGDFDDAPRGRREDRRVPRESFGERPREGFDRRRREGFGESPREGFEKRMRDNTAERHTRRFEEPQAEQPTAPDELPNIIMGRNPVKEAIKSGRSIDRILVTKEHDGSLNEILDLARDAKLVVRDVDRAKLDEICMPFGHNGRTGNHQGIVAYIPGVEYCELSDILDRAKEKGEPPFIVLLDGIEDPHNLGSVIRSAECAGAHGVVITKRRSASVTAAVVKTAAGATEHLPIAKVVNLSVAIDRLKEAGVWVAGADMSGEPLYSSNLKGPFALVIGAEGAGLSRLVADKCDYLVSIPLKGEMESLNASVAAAVIMFEKVRQDMTE